MNDEVRTAPGGTIDEDVDLTPTQSDEPAAAAPAGWSMPEPVFRKTSGYLPQGYEKRFGGGEAEPPSGEMPALASDPPPAGPPLDIEPQPELPEEFEPLMAEAAPAPASEGRSAIGKILLILVGLFVIVVLGAVFIAVVWYLLMPAAQSSFN